MKLIIRILAVAIAFSALSGGAYLFAANRSASESVAITDPIVVPAEPEPSTDPTEPDPATEPAPTPPTESANPDPADGKLIELSIERQELIAWDNGVEVYRFVVSTGRRGYETPTGRFKVHTKYENRWSRKWKVWMPYAMFWHPKYGYAFHELPYKPSSPNKRIGASKLGRPDSHGCVRVNVGDAQKLYEWAPVGTSVWIH